MLCPAAQGTPSFLLNLNPLKCLEKRLWKLSVICHQGDQDDGKQEQGPLGVATFLPSLLFLKQEPWKW